LPRHSEGFAVDSNVTPIFSPLPGYDDEIIMAAGKLRTGPSIELSADGPLKAPYIVYQQGGLT
jgi:cystathionine beta-lyase family protein involved in aluminum resistance